MIGVVLIANLIFVELIFKSIYQQIKYKKIDIYQLGFFNIMKLICEFDLG